MEIEREAGFISTNVWIDLFLLLFSSLDHPRVIDALRGHHVIEVAAGGSHSAACTTMGQLYTWGKGRYGRLGHKDNEDQLKPKLVSWIIPVAHVTRELNMIGCYG